VHNNGGATVDMNNINLHNGSKFVKVTLQISYFSLSIITISTNSIKTSL
jgi:hypothetical protein